MTFRLPSEIPPLLGHIYQSPAIYPLSFFILYLLGVILKNPPSTIKSKRDFIDVSTLQILTVIAVWFVLDHYFIHFDKPHLQKVFLFGRNLFSLFIGIVCVDYFYRNHRTEWRNLLGRLHPFHFLVALGLGIGAIISAGGWFISIIYPFEIILQSPQPITFEFSLFVLLTVLLIPVTEELFFRYYFYAYLRSRLGIVTGITLSSAVFALAHGFSIIVISIFIEAVLLTLLVEYTRSIIPGLILHGGFNFLITCGGFWL